MTIDDVMWLADSYADGPHEQGYYGARREALRAAIEQYAVEQRELVPAPPFNPAIEPPWHRSDNGPAEREQYARGDAEPVAWLLRPKVQRHPGRPMIRGLYWGPRTQEDFEFAELDGDEYVPLYTRPSRPLTKFQRMQIIGEDFPLALVEPIVIQKIDSVVRRTERAHGITE